MRSSRSTRSGRPILIGTTDVDKSIKLSDLLKRRGVKHELLNALPEHAAREADIVAQAGRIGAVTISTNMAGRGTDIILGGNPETMAWAKLATATPRGSTCPRPSGRRIIDDIEAKEKTKEEGRTVAAMGGLHIVGTERHEARRIDNQLRGRAGRQGDPGSSRFYLSLEDDLMRIFAGEWVSLAARKARHGRGAGDREPDGLAPHHRRPEEGRGAQLRPAQEPARVRRGHGPPAQGGLLLPPADARRRQRQGADPRHVRQADRPGGQALPGPRYGAGTFAEFAANRLGEAFDATEFARTDFEEAERIAHEKATRAAIAHEPARGARGEPRLARTPSEWNWQALASAVNNRYGMKTTDRQLKQIGKDNLIENLIAEAVKRIEQVDLSEGKPFLQPDWGVKSLCDWARLKFGIKLTADELAGKSRGRDPLADRQARMRELYRQKEIEFPVNAGMAQFMSEARSRPPAGRSTTARGCIAGRSERFPAAAEPDQRGGLPHAVAASG